MITTPGRLLLRQIIPPDVEIPEELDAAGFNALVEAIASKHPDKYASLMDELSDVGIKIATERGREASLRLSDFRAPAKVKSVLDDYRREVYKISQRDDLTSDQKFEEMTRLSAGISEELKKKLYEQALQEGNRMALQIHSGSRGGSKAKVLFAQMLLGDPIYRDVAGRGVPISEIRTTAEGYLPSSYFAASTVARRALADVQLATAKAGYLSRQLAGVAHRQVVTMKDCGTDRGILVDGGDPGNEGAVLSRDYGKYKAGTPVTQNMLEDLSGMRIIIRSPLSCDAGDGVCAYCTGLREKGTLPDIGEAVGINATKAFTEPLTQISISSKHAGTSRRVGHRTLSGFKEINQFVQMPKEFEGSAALADRDGFVDSIKPASQGGVFVNIGESKIHVPAGVNLVVAQGDKVEAGDVLSEGIPDPAEIMRYKGLGAGRLYFMNQFYDILKRNGIKTDRRNVEIFARPMVGKVRVTSSDHFPGYLEGDVVDYDALARTWEPREGSELKKLTSAANLYLEKPYLHYTIGTRITKKVLDDLKAAGYDGVLTHKQPPPFEPVAIRAQDYLAYDPDWMTRMAGERLEQRMLETVERGGKSSFDSTSYFPKIIGMGYTKDRSAQNGRIDV